MLMQPLILFLSGGETLGRGDGGSHAPCVMPWYEGPLMPYLPTPGPVRRVARVPVVLAFLYARAAVVYT